MLKNQSKSPPKLNQILLNSQNYSHTMSRTRTRTSTQYFPSTGKTISCRYCKAEGHVIRCCPVLAAKEDRRRRQGLVKAAAVYAPDEDGFSLPRKSFRRRANKTNSVKLNISSRFDTLAEKNEKSPVKKSVTIERPKATQPRKVTGCWSKPLVVKTEEASISTPKKMPKKHPVKAPKKETRRWADLADEDSDDDDDFDMM